MNQRKGRGDAAGLLAAAETENREGRAWEHWAARAELEPVTTNVQGHSHDTSTAGERGGKLKCWALSRQQRGEGMQESDETMGETANH